MAGLLYFLPGQGRGIGLEEIKTLGLGYAFDRKPTTPGVQRGPDGKAGILLADPRCVPEHRIKFYPDQQTWRRIPSIDAWVGLYTDDRPKPNDLIRQKTLPGHWVELGDGEEWLIPIARGLLEQEDGLVWYQALPEITTIDDEGDWIRAGVRPQYALLWQIALDWWDQIAGLEESDEQEPEDKVRLVFDFERVSDAALTALRTNYRVNRAEIALLAVFDDASKREILDALVDRPTMREFLRKKVAAAGSNSGAGPAADTPPTDPA